MMKWIIASLILYICFSCNNYMLCRYNNSDIFKKKEKVSIDFIFDKDYNREERNSESKFDKYFFTYNDTELTLVNGARMICRHPQKINLENSKPTQNDKLFSPQMNSITSLIIDWGYIFFREINKLCYNQVFDKWIYKICPSRSATQILSYNKIDENSGQEVKEINILGYGLNDTDLMTEEQLFNEEKGMTIDTFMNHYSPLSHNLNLTHESFFVNYRLVKLFNTHLLDDLKDQKIILEMNCKLPILMDKNKSIRVNKYIKSIDDYLKDNPNAKEIPITREVIAVVNPQLLLLDFEGPPDQAYSVVLYEKIDQEKGNENAKKVGIMLDNDIIFSEKLNFLNYPNMGYLTIYHNNEYEIKRVVKILDEKLIRINPPFTSNSIIPIDKITLFYSINNYLIIKGQGLMSKLKNFLIGDISSLVGNQQIKPGDYIYFLKELSPVVFVPSLDMINQCQVKAIIESKIYLLEKNAQCNHNSLSKIPYIIISKQLMPGKEIPYIKTYLTIAEDTSNDLSSFKYVTLASTKTHYKTKTHFKVPKSNITTFQFNLTSIDNKNTSSLSLYLANNKNVTNQDYEILINSKSGVLIKQIGNHNNIAFYTKEMINFFIESTECEIIIFNSTIYFNSKDSDTLYSIKVKYPFETLNPINHLYINRLDSSNIIVKGMNIVSSITKENILGIFIYEKKYSLNDDVTFYDTFTNGDSCESGKNRTVQVEYRCDLSGMNDLIINKVKEDKLCEYKYIAASKFLCNPHTLMNNVIQNSISQVTCISKDNNYNKNTRDFFS